MTITTRSVRLAIGSIVALALTTAALAAQSANDLTLRYREALHKQQVEGDLAGAISLYRQIVSSPNAARAVVANSLLQLGDCYEKQGNSTARGTYERLVREYADQEVPVRAARVRLAVMAQRDAPRRDVVIRRIGEWPGTVEVRTVSRDGRVVAAADSARVRSEQLVLVDVVTGARQLLGQPALERGQSVTTAGVSPDGAQVVYTTYDITSRASDIRLIATTAGTPRVLHTHDRSLLIADWSRDGSTVLLLEGEWLGIARGAFEGFARLEVATGRVTRIPLTGFTGSIAGSIVATARLSPDGRFFAFAASEGNDTAGPDGPSRSRVIVAATDGSSHHALTDSVNAAFPAAWTSDGRQLLYVSNQSGSPDLWSVALENGRPTGEPRMRKREIGTTTSLAMDDAGRLFYPVVRAPGRAYLGDLGDGTVTNLRPVTSPSGDYTSAIKWSPVEGSRVAVLRLPGPGSPFVRIWIRELGSGQEREVVPPGGAAFTVHGVNWTPDGSGLVAVVRTEDGQRLAWVDGTGRVRMGASLATPNTFYRNPVQSRDGRHVFATKRLQVGPEVTALIDIDLQTQSEAEICRGQGLIGLAPDHSQAACGQANGIVRLVSLRGGAATELTTGVAGTMVETSWTPDGRGVIVAQDDQRQSGDLIAPRRRFSLLATSGGAARRLNVPVGTSTVTVDPEGRRVSTVNTESSTELYVIENIDLR